MFRYPNVTRDDIAEACPVCRGICNCKACLRLDVPGGVSLSLMLVFLFSNCASTCNSMLSSIPSSFAFCQQIPRMFRNVDASMDEQLLHAKYLLQAVLPFLEQLNEEQLIERDIEARMQGTAVLNVD